MRSFVYKDEGACDRAKTNWQPRQIHYERIENQAVIVIKNKK